MFAVTGIARAIENEEARSGTFAAASGTNDASGAVADGALHLTGM